MPTPFLRRESLLDGNQQVAAYVFSVETPAAMKQHNWPEAVSEALLHRQGKYAPYLKLAIACEESDQDTLRTLAAECSMDAGMVNQRHIEALTWAMSFSEALEDLQIGE